MTQFSINSLTLKVTKFPIFQINEEFDKINYQFFDFVIKVKILIINCNP